VIGLVYLSNALLKKRNADEQIAFFNNITHELKTPLSILLSTLDNAAQTTAGEQANTKKIKTTVKRLSTLFEQLLNFNKVTSNGQQKKEIFKIPLPDHVQKIANSFKPLLKERNISIRVTTRGVLLRSRGVE
ncbi:MAG: sensor histidine kinase, partial [Saprospiraceae bacterium]